MNPLTRALAVVSGLALLALAPASAGAASSASRSADAYRAVPGTPPARHAGHPRQVDPERFHAFAVDQDALASVLRAAPTERPTARRGGDALTVSVPGPDGADQRFAVQASNVLDDELAAAHPEIATYVGVGVDDPRASIRLDLTPLGLHASVVGPGGAWYVDPYYQGDRSLYVAYRRQDLGSNPHGPLIEPENPLAARAPGALGDALPRAGGQVTQRTYRLALVTDPTYAAYFGAANVLSAKTVLMDRVNQLYDDDFAVRMMLVNPTVPVGSAAGQDPSGDKLNLDTNAEMYGANGPCGTAACYPVSTPASASCTDDLLQMSYTAIPQLMAGAPYDIGHIGLGTNGGGIAALEAVGDTSKSQGCTGIPTPVGDYYAVDYVAHEMGHEFNGNHTFAGTLTNCATGNRNDGAGSEGQSAPGTSVEPGSGSSVMAYAGICAADNLQAHSDPYFSQRSISEISTYVASSRPDLSENQTVSLRGFGTGGSFALSSGTSTTAAITRAAYSASTIETRLAAIGIASDVTPYGEESSLGPDGFVVTFQDTVDHPLLQVVNGAGGTTGFAGETVKGGPPTNGGTASATSNVAPTVSVPATTYLPLRTPFTLTGSGSDPTGDPLTFLWEQNDPNASGGTALVSNGKRTGPLFRVFSGASTETTQSALTSPAAGENAATASPSRTFPDLAQVVAGNTNARTGSCPTTTATGSASSPVPAAIVDCYSEYLPTSSYTGTVGSGPALHFRLTARDNHANGGGTGAADATLQLDTSAGPFLVTSQATASSAVAGGPLQVTWDSANTDDALVNVQNVRILLSTDGGQTFGTVLADSTPNDDAATVTLPAGATTSAARIQVQAIGGVFFDVSDANLTITAPGAAGQDTGGSGTGGQTTPATPAPAATPAPSTSPSPAATSATSTPATPKLPALAVGQLRPSLASVRGRLKVTTAGRLAIRVRCAAVAGTGTPPSTCAGRVRITARIGRRTVTIGTARFSGPRARVQTVRVRLTSRGRRAAATRRGVVARLTVTVTSGRTPRTGTKTVRVLG